mmetsp:Transcript_57831/g.159937  ORF Transcript_57831/g.159937 Transcript_57831/m.159937 type:complete len:225 (+) Transcript_57831:970-1644(+)
MAKSTPATFWPLSSMAARRAALASGKSARACAAPRRSGSSSTGRPALPGPVEGPCEEERSISETSLAVQRLGKPRMSSALPTSGSWVKSFSSSLWPPATSRSSTMVFSGTAGEVGLAAAMLSAPARRAATILAVLLARAPPGFAEWPAAAAAATAAALLFKRMIGGPCGLAGTTAGAVEAGWRHAAGRVDAGRTRPGLTAPPPALGGDAGSGCCGSSPAPHLGA